MKKIILVSVVTLFCCFVARAQADPKLRDSVSNTADFQYKVRSASLIAGYQLLADTANLDPTVGRYAQLLISQPQGGWITAMSYGTMTNPAINYDSPMNDIQFQINSIFTFQSYAHFGVSPIAPPPVIGMQ